MDASTRYDDVDCPNAVLVLYEIIPRTVCGRQ